MRVSREFVNKAIKEDGRLVVWVGAYLLTISATYAMADTPFGTIYPDREQMIAFVVTENWEKVEYKHGRWAVEK